MVGGRVPRPAWKAVRRAIGFVLVGSVGTVVLLVGSFLLPSLRGVWLGAGLGRALRTLPGELHGHWSWPRLDSFAGRDLVWTAPAADGTTIDTLAVVESAVVRIDLRGLRGHDLLVEQFTATASRLDLPGIQQLLRPLAMMPARTEGVAPVPFLRAGSVPTLPSLRVRGLDVAVDRLLLPDGIVAADMAVTGSASVLAGGTPQLVVRSLSGRAESRIAPLWTVDLASARAAATYDAATRAVTLDSLVGRLPAFVFRADSLQVETGPLDLSVRGSWRDDVGDLAAELHFHARVPVPLQNPLPGMVMREFAGRLGLQCHGTATDLRLDAELDLDPSADLRRGMGRGSALVSLRPQPRLRQLRVDALGLQWRGTTLEASGAWDGATIDGRVTADLQDLEFPALLAPGLLAGVRGRLKATGAVVGPLADPRITATATAAGTIASVWQLPGVARAAAGLPAGIDRAAFSRIDLDLEGGLDGSWSELSADLRVDLGRTPWLDRGLLVGHAKVAPRSRALGHLRVDSLAVALRGTGILASGDLDTAQADLAVTLTMDGTGLLDLLLPDSLRVTDLGLVSRLRISGPWRDLQGEGNLNGHLLTQDFDLSEFQATLVGSPRELQVRARARGGVRLGSVAVDSLAVAWTGRPLSTGGIPAGDFLLHVWAPETTGWLRGSAAGDTVRTATIDTLVFTAAGQEIHAASPFTLRSGPGPRDLSVSTLHLRGDPGSLDLDASLAGEGLMLAAGLDLLLSREWLESLFPSPFWSADEGADLAVSGVADLSNLGTAAGRAPVFQGRAGVRLIPRNQEPEARIDLDFHLAAGDTAGLAGNLTFGIGETRLVSGSLTWPGRIDAASGRWFPAAAGHGRLDLNEQELPLAFINGFLPTDVSLEGNLTVGAGVAVSRAAATAAPATDSAISGVIRTRGLRVNLPNRSRLDLTGNIGVTGRLVDPRLAGESTVTSGLIRLQESQPLLHPASGAAALWTAAREAAADSSGPAGATWRRSDASVPEVSPLFVPDLDLHVLIPGNFKVIGYGLEAELAGDIRIVRGLDGSGRPAPVLRGRLRVVEGTLRAFNRTFTVESGGFDLAGSIPLNPSVDLVLVADIDGTRVRIKVTGSSQQPRIVLESEPEMIQADIMAFLLFGRPLNELDTDQRVSLNGEQSPVQQLSRNLQGLALLFGATGFQNSVSGRIGVDQVQIGSDTAGGSTLVLGKFINPRLLLKYHQSLERSGSYFMTLEYTLSRLFKLISTYGQNEEASGLDLRWQQRY